MQHSDVYHKRAFRSLREALDDDLREELYKIGIPLTYLNDINKYKFVIRELVSAEGYELKYEVPQFNLDDLQATFHMKFVKKDQKKSKRVSFDKDYRVMRKSLEYYPHMVWALGDRDLDIIDLLKISEELVDEVIRHKEAIENLAIAIEVLVHMNSTKNDNSRAAAVEKEAIDMVSKAREVARETL